MDLTSQQSATSQPGIGTTADKQSDLEALGDIFGFKLCERIIFFVGEK
jgi:hypothetical protein